jgi:hypothetical protein
MQIPDLKRMLVNTKVHEALVSRVRRGQRALVRVDADRDRVLRGHVESVATLSSQQDWLSADVKVYTTKVAIDEEVEGLKPNLSAEVTIIVADPLERVLTVPIEAVVGSSEMREHRTCFVLTPDGPAERPILIGQRNDRMVEVREGLAEGEEVVLNPQTLVGDRVKTRRPGAGNGNGNGTPDGAPNGATDQGKPAAKPDQPAAPGNGGPARGPEAGPGPDRAAPADQGGGRAQKSPEERQRQQQQMLERFRQAAPEKRKEMLEQIPAAYRDRVKDLLKAQGVEVPN